MLCGHAGRVFLQIARGDVQATGREEIVFALCHRLRWCDLPGGLLEDIVRRR